MKILVLGSGGREHAITWKLQQSHLVEKVYTMPGNGGTENNIIHDLNDFEGIEKICVEKEIDLIFVGPEAPLANGIVDYFRKTDIKIFGPDKKASQLEGSKIFAKKFMEKYGVATADFKVFGHKSDNGHDLDSIIRHCNGNCVIKFDGLAAGKGVYVCDCDIDARNAISELRVKYGEHVAYLIENKLIGKEISILAFTDGKQYKLVIPSQDHKQLLDGDRGPNTGGMGAYCPVTFFDQRLKDDIVQHIIDPTMKGIQSEGFDYKGVIYFGIMITEDGPKLLEYNVRLGDPETEVIMPAMSTDLTGLVLSCLNGTLDSFDLYFKTDYFVDVVLVSGGYPQSYSKGFEIEGLEKLDHDTLVFHAGTKWNKGDLVTSGGRVLNIICKATTLKDAVKKVYKEAEKIYFPEIFYRSDIGKRDDS